MKAMICKNCGGAMVINTNTMTALCKCCDSEFILEEKDFGYYRDFRRSMSGFLSAKTDEHKEKADRLWLQADKKSFVCKDSRLIEIAYLYNYSVADADIYVARRNIIFHFKSDGAAKINAYRRNTSMLDYPSADTRRLSDFFPKVSGSFELSDSTHILIISKTENEYPLRIFGKLDPKHVAWVISRMENLCCVLEYNSMTHYDISVDSLFIDPYTHQASLYGNWWRVDTGHSRRPNLMGLRDTAAELLGYGDAFAMANAKDIHPALCSFISGEPRDNAYDDFALWDDVLIKAFGERRFITFDTDDEQIYKG